MPVSPRRSSDAVSLSRYGPVPGVPGVSAIRDRLPIVPVPLKQGDPDVPLDLQAAFDVVYDRARYDLSLDYNADLQPPPGEVDAPWIRGRLATLKR